MESNIGNKLCSVSIVFPYTDNTDLLANKTKVDKVLAELGQVKIEYRFIEVADGSRLDRPNGNT